MNFKFLSAILLATTMLFGCGGTKKEQGTIRLINASTDYATLDLYSTDSRLATGVVMSGASSYISTDEGNHTFRLKRGDSSTTSLETTQGIVKDTAYTLLAFTSGQQLSSLYLADNEAEPSSGNAKIRFVNTSTDAGSVDVYVSEVGASLSDISATTSALPGSPGITSYATMTKGTYRIRVTGTGDKADLRLDIPSVVLDDKKIVSLVLTNTSGGVLVDGLLITQGGTVNAQKNNSARMRLVADATANGSVTATANGVALAAGLKSPAVSAYSLVPAGAVAIDLSINGNTVNTSGISTAVAGTDLTLLVMGDAASPKFSLLSDNNRLATSGNAKLRLVNGVNGLNGNLTLTADYNAIANDIATGTASTSASVTSGSSMRVEVTSSTASTSLYLNTDVTLQSTRVYSLFFLGDSAAPVGVLRRDR